MSRAADAVRARAEIVKLARILGCPADELGYLEGIDVADLRALRAQIVERLWSDDNAVLSRIAAASKLLPVPVIATIAQRAFGPLLTARLTTLIEPSRAVDVAGRLPTEFLADIAVELDPRRAGTVLVSLEAARIGAITRVLAERGEEVTMGGFVGHLGDDAIRAALAEMDDATLLRVGFVLEDKGRLPLLVSLLSEQRIRGLIVAAAREELWVQALDLLGHLRAEQRAAIIEGALQLSPDAVEALIAAVIRHELWDEVRLISDPDSALQQRLADRIAHNAQSIDGLPALPLEPA